MHDYLTDVLNQLIEEAIELKSQPQSEFEEGLLTGYYRAISKLLNQAEAFGIAKFLPSDLRQYDVEKLLE